VQAVYASHDDEPAALARDARVRGLLADAGVVLHTVKDHVIFERSEVLTQSGSPTRCSRRTRTPG
jgi:deoxyribodipyrimidine photo-lyase